MNKTKTKTKKQKLGCEGAMDFCSIYNCGEYAPSAKRSMQPGKLLLCNGCKRKIAGYNIKG